MRKSFRDVPHAYDNNGMQIIYIDGEWSHNDARARLRMERANGDLDSGCQECGYSFLYYSDAIKNYICELCGGTRVRAGERMVPIARYVRNAT